MAHPLVVDLDFIGKITRLAFTESEELWIIWITCQKSCIHLLLICYKKLSITLNKRPTRDIQILKSRLHVLVKSSF